MIENDIAHENEAQQNELQCLATLVISAEQLLRIQEFSQSPVEVAELATLWAAASGTRVEIVIPKDGKRPVVTGYVIDRQGGERPFLNVTLDRSLNPQGY